MLGAARAGPQPQVPGRWRARGPYRVAVCARQPRHPSPTSSTPGPPRPGLRHPPAEALNEFLVATTTWPQPDLGHDHVRFVTIRGAKIGQTSAAGPWVGGPRGCRVGREVTGWWLRLTGRSGSHILNAALCSGAVRHGPAQSRMAVEASRGWSGRPGKSDRPVGPCGGLSRACASHSPTICPPEPTPT